MSVQDEIIKLRLELNDKIRQLEEAYNKNNEKIDLLHAFHHKEMKLLYRFLGEIEQPKIKKVK